MLILLLYMTVCAGGRVYAQASSYGELQAAYLYNFAKYVKWPRDPAVFIIGIYGGSDITDELETTLTGKKVAGKSIELKTLTGPGDIGQCHIIYVSESHSKSISLIKETVGSSSILIVTEEDLIKKGATISFVVEDDRLKFKLKKSALSNAGLTATEGLLRLAILQ